MTTRATITLPAQAASVSAHALRFGYRGHLTAARVGYPGPKTWHLTHAAVHKCLALAIEAQVNP